MYSTIISGLILNFKWQNKSFYMNICEFDPHIECIKMFYIQWQYIINVNLNICHKFGSFNSCIIVWDISIKLIVVINLYFVCFKTIRVAPFPIQLPWYTILVTLCLWVLSSMRHAINYFFFINVEFKYCTQYIYIYMPCNVQWLNYNMWSAILPIVPPI